MKPRIVFALLLAVLLPFAQGASTGDMPVMSLDGEWELELDRAGVGVAERWFAKDLPRRVRLPGTLSGQGFGDPVDVKTPWIGGIVDQSWFTAPEYASYRQPGNIKIPFWLQPETYYAGIAWYRRSITILADWSTRRVFLTLERPHWQTRVWLDDREIGTNDSLSVAHRYDLGIGLTPGRHTLTIRVNNSLVVDVGINAHSVSDHTQGNWNGIVGRVELAAYAPATFDDLQVYPHVATKSATVKGRVSGADRLPPGAPVTISVGVTAARIARLAADGTFTLEYPLGQDAATWDEFQPTLHRLTARLENGEAKTVTFGLREIATAGSQLTLNGRKLFLRGTLECAIFPKLGHPPTDVAAWKRLLGVARAHGLNHLRFHSWCPPEAAFVAADELGFYYQIEAATWPNQSTTLGDGKPVDQWVHDETARILQAYGNHPSFILMTHGNEPGGKQHRAFLAKYVDRYKALDSRMLWTSGAGWPELPENQFHVLPAPRIQAWGGGLKSRINAKPPETMTDYRAYIAARRVPVVSHEIGQWCVYPNFDEIPKYTGFLKARNFEIFRDTLAARGLAAQAKDFLLASGKLQALCYKEDIESALRTPGMGGFQLLDLHDFPGQGTALVGVLDAFWEEKGYITATEYARFSGPTVPLARLAKRVFTADETLTARIELAHFGAAPLSAAQPEWKLLATDGRVVAQGRWPARAVPIGNGLALGEVSVPLATLPAPARYRLEVSLAGTAIANDWDVWVYPTTVATTAPAGVTITRQLDAAALAELERGGRVLWLIPPAQVKNSAEAPVKLGFSSIFWNTAWTKRQAPTTLGILCDPRAPALAAFPTESHSNWQWWYLVSQAGALILDDLPRALRPTVQVIDDWFTNRKLGLVIEAKVGRGKLVACSIDLDADANPVSRQFKHSLLRYMAGEAFAPAVSLTREQLLGLVTAEKPAAERPKS
jgi:hypothetical protein